MQCDILLFAGLYFLFFFLLFFPLKVFSYIIVNGYCCQCGCCCVFLHLAADLFSHEAVLRMKSRRQWNQSAASTSAANQVKNHFFFCPQGVNNTAYSTNTQISTIHTILFFFFLLLLLFYLFFLFFLTISSRLFGFYEGGC